MRIAQIAPPWFAVPPVGYGGIEWVVSLLADGLAQRGHDVTLYATGDSTTKATLVSVFDEAPGGAMIGDVYMDALHATRAYLDADDYDLVHDHSGLIGPAIGSHCAVPVVHTLHGPFTEKAKTFYRLLSGLWFVAISEAQRGFCPDLSYAATIHNGIDLAHYPYRERKDDFLLFLGRINAEKGPEIAVDVARRTGKKLVMAVKMVEEPELEYWREVVEPRLTGDEEIIGELTLEEKGELVSRAGAVLFPIQWPEPFGLVMAEAMACGTPVIAMAQGAAPEVVVDGETGFLVNSVDEMVARVGEIGQISAKIARDHVRRHFSAEVMVQRYEQAFERILAQ